MGSQDAGDGAGGGTSGVSAAEQAKKDSLFEDRPGAKKIIRVVTVMAYMVSVSFVAIVLSGYYVFLWQPPNPRLLHRAHLKADPQFDYRVIDETAEVRKIDINERINVYREQFLRNRGIEISSRTSHKNASVNDEETRKNVKNQENLDNNDTSLLRGNKSFDVNSENSSDTWNPFVRAFLASRMVPSTMETTTTEKMERSTIHESVNNASMTKTSNEASGLMTKSQKNNEKIFTNLSDANIMIPQSFHELADKETNVSIVRPIDEETFDTLVDDEKNDHSNDSDEKTSSTESYNLTEKSGYSGHREIIGKDTMKSLEKLKESGYAGSGEKPSYEIGEDQTIGNLDDEGKNREETILRPNELGEESKDKLYEPKHRQKVVRVLTVVAYVVSVSLAAIILSLYYTFIWDPKDHALYTIRQNSLNSSSKIECLNLTIPVISELTRTINGSHISRVPLTKLVTNESIVTQKNATNLSFQRFDKDFVADSRTEYIETSSETTKLTFESLPLIVQPESKLSEEEEKLNEGTEKRLTQDTSDFDFI